MISQPLNIDYEGTTCTLVAMKALTHIPTSPKRKLSNKYLARKSSRQFVWAPDHLQGANGVIEVCQKRSLSIIARVSTLSFEGVLDLYEISRTLRARLGVYVKER